MNKIDNQIWVIGLVENNKDKKHQLQVTHNEHHITPHITIYHNVHH